MSLLLAALAVLLQGQPPGQAVGGDAPVVVASKPFGESYLLAELFAQILEARGIRVDRRPGLGATEIAFQAIRSGAVDVYPEYTGTGLVAILGQSPMPDEQEVFATVSREFRDRWGIRWLPPLGFQNTYAIAVRRATADSLRLRTLSDLGAAGASLVAGFTPDFIGRDDGLPGLTRVYGLRFREVRSLLQAIKYEAIAARRVDIIDGYSTDGFLARYDLVVLEDDLGLFPAYQAAPLLSARAASRPATISALTELAGRIDAATMRRLNQRVEVDNEPVRVVAADALESLGLITAADPGTRAGRPGSRESLLEYLWRERSRIGRLTLRHLMLVAVALGCAVLIALPLGLLLERLTRGAETAIRATGLLQTVPSIALLAFMIPLFGIGVRPALVALFLYALYPIVRNTYSGVRATNPDAVAAAEALGMTRLQILGQVRMPLAAPVIMAGIRTAAVITVGTATLAAFIGGGGLGDPIVAGLALSDTRMVLSGAIPAATLALVVDGLLAGVERLVRPRV